PTIMALQSTCSLFHGKLDFKFVISPEYARQLSQDEYAFTRFLYVVANKDQKGDEELFNILWKNRSQANTQGLIPGDNHFEVVKPFTYCNVAKFLSLSLEVQSFLLSDAASKLFSCIQKNDIKAVKIFLLSPLKTNLNWVDSVSSTSLLEKSCNCHTTNILQLLLENGASLMHPSKKTYNICHYLCAK